MSHDDGQIGRRLGPFVLEERLGDHGAVYHAIHVEHRRSVAVKLLDPLPAPDERAVQEFSRELLFLQTLQHPHVVPCYGGGVQELQPYLAWELVRGESLDVRLRRAGPLPWPQAMAVARQACEALSYADHRNVQHFRLSPSKILLGDDGVTRGIVKVCDFRRPRGPIGLPAVEHAEQLAAMAYQAPEQICGKPPVSPATDVYALGCILFEMLVGRPPFEGRTPRDMAQQQLTAAPPRVALLVPDCPVWLDALVAQLLEKLPPQRLQSASEVGVALEEAADKVTSGASVAEHSLSGAPSSLRSRPADAAARQLLPRRKLAGLKGPIYERAWFLSACLAALILLVAWVVWPASDEKLLAEAHKLMAGEDRVAWDVARRNYLTPLLARSPAAEIALPAQEMLDRIEAEEARERMQRNVAQGRSPSSQGERLFLQAKQYHDFGDAATALVRYQQLSESLAESQSDRGFAKLAERRGRELGQHSGKLASPREFLEQKLIEADELAAKDELPAARRIWDRILALYPEQEDVRPQYQRAQQRRLGMNPDAKTPAAP